MKSFYLLFFIVISGFFGVVYCQITTIDPATLGVDASFITDVKYCGNGSGLRYITLAVSRSGKEFLQGDNTYILSYSYAQQDGTPSGSTKTTIATKFYGDMASFSLDANDAVKTKGQAKIIIHGIQPFGGTAVTFLPIVEKDFTVPEVTNYGTILNTTSLSINAMDTACTGNDVYFTVDRGSLSENGPYKMFFRVYNGAGTNNVGDYFPLEVRRATTTIYGQINVVDESVYPDDSYKLKLEYIENTTSKCFATTTGIDRDFTIKKGSEGNIQIQPIEDFCQNDDSFPDVTLRGFTAGRQYDIVYSVSGANTFVETTVAGETADANGNIFISQDNSIASNAGTNIFSVKSVTVNGCTSDYNPPLSEEYTVTPTPSIGSSDIEVPPATCINASLPIKISNPGFIIPNVKYQMTYNIGSSSQVLTSASDGTGLLSFEILGTEFTAKGYISIVVTAMSATVGVESCLATLSNVNLPVFVDKPDLQEDEFSVSDACSDPPEVSFTSPKGLTTGQTYAISYQITSESGNVLPGRSSIDIGADGNGSFSFHEDANLEIGTTTMTITSVQNKANSCGVSGLGLKSNPFSVIRFDKVDFDLEIVDKCTENRDYSIKFQNLLGMRSGLYNFGYELGGVNRSDAPQDGEFALAQYATDASFDIPQDLIQEDGNTTVNILYVEDISTACRYDFVSPEVLDSDFVVALPPTLPDLTHRPKDNLFVFCKDKSFTFKDLTGKLPSGYLGTVTWHSKPYSGETYADTDILTGSTFVYAQTNNKTCRSEKRLKVNLVVPDCRQIELSKGVSPNGDGINDSLVVESVTGIDDLSDIFPDYEIQIFDRIGRIVFTGGAKSPPFSGKPSPGAEVSDILLDGVYYYVIDFKSPYRNPEQGYFYLHNHP